MTKNKLFMQLVFFSAFMLIGTIVKAQLKVGNNPTTINANSVLEIESTNKGLLLPRLGLSSTTSFSPLAAHVAGMTVYNTATAGDVTPGFYYNDGTKWVRIASPTVGNNTTAANLITITNGTGATLTAMTVGVDTTALKTFLNNKVQVSVNAPLTGNGSATSPLGITQNNTSAGQLITVTNGTGASFTAMTVGVDTTALKTFINSSLGKTTSAGSLIAVTNGAGAALKDNTVAVDTTALKSFLNNKVLVTTTSPITGDGTTSNPIGVTRATATSGVLTTVTNGTNATFTALQYDVDTTALKTFLNNKVQVTASSPLSGNGTSSSPLTITQNTLSAGSLVTVTGGTNATFTAASVAVDTTALKAFVSGKTAVSVSAPITGDGTTSNPISVTRATATSGVLTTVTNGTNAAFTALKYDVDTTALKTFISTSMGKNTTAGSLVTVTNGTGAALVNNTVAVDTTALKAFVSGKTAISVSAPITGDGTISNPISVTRATATSGVLTTVTNGTNAAFTALQYDVDTTALKTFINGRTTNTLTNPTNTITSTVNGVVATAPAVNTNVLTLTADTLTSSVNGVLSNKVSLSAVKKLGVVTTAATSYTIPDTADVVIFNGTANTTFTLPSASVAYGRELRILNFAQSDANVQITLSTSVITEGASTNVTDTRINSKGSTYQFPAGLGSQVFNTITLISNGTTWYKLGN